MCAKTSAKHAANVQTWTANFPSVLGSAKDMRLHILAKVFVLSAESVWTQPVRKVLAQTSVLVTQHHTAVKTSVLIVENAPTKLVQKPFA